MNSQSDKSTKTDEQFLDELTTSLLLASGDIAQVNLDHEAKTAILQHFSDRHPSTSRGYLLGFEAGRKGRMTVAQAEVEAEKRIAEYALETYKHNAHMDAEKLMQILIDDRIQQLQAKQGGKTE